MSTKIRLVAEYYDTVSGKTITLTIIREDDIKKPTTIKDLGYLHEEQIKIHQSIIKNVTPAIYPSRACTQKVP